MKCMSNNNDSNEADCKIRLLLGLHAMEQVEPLATFEQVPIFPFAGAGLRVHGSDTRRRQRERYNERTDNKIGNEHRNCTSKEKIRFTSDARLSARQSARSAGISCSGNGI